MAFTGEGLKIDGIGHFLSDHFLRVPVNQRSYMWEEDHVGDFWNDIISAMQEPPGTDYFIGSIVLSGEKGGVLEVVDGQQRLATTTIMLAVIRDYFREVKNLDRANNIETNYLITRDEDTLQPEPHLTLNTDDNLFFKSHVTLPATGERRENPLDATQKKRLKDSHKNIARAAKMMRTFVFQHVANTRPDDATNRLKRIVKYVRDSVKAITVLVPTHDDAYTIFETLNDRGLDLSKADLLKNHLFRASGNQQKDVEAKWAGMNGALETVTRKDITVDYIRYLWIATHGHVRAKALYKHIKREVSEQGQAVELAHNLAESAVSYAGILNSDHPKWDEYGEPTKADLSNLIMLGIERMHPITLAMVRTFTVQEARKAFYYLVCASVRVLIASPAPGGVFEERIAEIAPSVSNGTIRTAKALAAEMNRRIVPSDAVFATQFAVANVSRTDLARYYLRALNNATDKHEQHPARVVKDQAKGNIEHVLPISRSPAWAHVKEDVAKAYYKRIGNLALLRPKDNADIGNKDFLTVKVPAYAASTFELTRRLAEVQTPWNASDIERWQKELAMIAVRTWPITFK